MIAKYRMVEMKDLFVRLGSVPVQCEKGFGPSLVDLFSTSTLWEPILGCIPLFGQSSHLLSRSLWIHIFYPPLEARCFSGFSPGSSSCLIWFLPSLSASLCSSSFIVLNITCMLVSPDLCLHPNLSTNLKIPKRWLRSCIDYPSDSLKVTFLEFNSSCTIFKTRT